MASASVSPSPFSVAAVLLVPLDEHGKPKPDLEEAVRHFVVGIEGAGVLRAKNATVSDKPGR